MNIAVKDKENRAPRQVNSFASVRSIKKGDYQEYERLKRALPNDLTPSEYEARVRAIADRCGV